MADYSILVDPLADSVAHAAPTPTAVGTALTVGYRGTVGGALLREVLQRAGGVVTGNTTTAFPAGWRWRMWNGSPFPKLASVVDSKEYSIWCLDPSGPAVWQWFEDIKVELLAAVALPEPGE